MLHIQGFLELGLFQESGEILLHAGLGGQEEKYTAVAKCYLYHMLALWVRNRNPVTLIIE